MPYTIPDNDVAFNTNQSIWFETDISILVAALAGVVVVTGCTPTAQGTPDMTVAIAAGTIQIADGSRPTVSSGNVTIGAAHGTNPRIDLITASATGVKTVTAGTAAPQPKTPALPSGHVGIAFVYVPANDTAIASNQIVDKRVLSDDVHAQIHALSGADHTGEITDAQHGARTVANAHQHSQIGGIGANDHHAQVHGIGSSDHTGNLTTALHGALAGPASAHRHSDMASIGTDDHHAQSHTHASHTSIGANDHHAQTHTHASHTSIGVNDHHNKSHNHIDATDGSGIVNYYSLVGGPTGTSTALANPVAMTNANTEYDGPSLDLATGTWLLMGRINIQTPGGSSSWINARLNVGGTTFDEASGFMATPGGALPLAVFGWAVLGSTTTVKIVGIASAAGCTILDTNPSNGLTDEAATLVAVRLE